MPPRLKIVADNDQVYEYTSPLKREFVLRKLMKFTVPVPVIPFSGKEDLTQFDDVHIHGNVVFAARAGSDEAASKYRELAEDQRERFYFFLNVDSELGSDTLVLQAVGHNFTRNATFTAATPLEDLRRFLEVAQAQDLEVLEYSRHIVNETYLSSLAGRLVVFGMAGL